MDRSRRIGTMDELTLFVIFVYLKISLPTGVIRSFAFSKLFIRNFMNLKFVCNVRIDLTLGSMKDPFWTVANKFVVFPSINPKDFNFESSFVNDTDVARLGVQRENKERRKRQ